MLLLLHFGHNPGGGGEVIKYSDKPNDIVGADALFRTIGGESLYEIK